MAEAQSYNLRNQDEYMNPTARFVSAYEEGLCDWKFRIYQEEDCEGNAITGLMLYIDAFFNPMDYEEDIEDEENGFGKKTIIRKTITRIPNFDVVVDQLHNEYFFRLACTPNLRLHVKDGNTYKITDLSVERKGVISNYLLELTIKLTFEDDSFIELGYISCCRPAYEDAPFVDDCPDLPGSTDDCGDFAVSISLAGSILTATPTAPPGSVTINWMYRENVASPWTLLAPNASSVTLGAFGHYKATAVSQGCSVDDTYLYLDPCSSITVTITDNGVGLVAVGSGCDTPSFAWYVWDEINQEWDEMYTGGPSYVPPGAGIYKVVLSGCDDCTAEAIANWDGSGCTLTTTLDVDEGSLVVFHDPCEGGSQTYDWYLDQGTGPELVQSGELATLAIAGPGLYEVYVICDDSDCQGYARKVVTCDDPCLITLDIAVVADIATATVTGCDEESASFTWYRNQGTGYMEAGTGNPFDLPGSGLYKLTVVCGDCTVSQEFFHCPGASDCQKSQYFSNFSGTELTITAFTVPNPDDVTEKYIRDNLWVFRQGSKISYDVGFTLSFVDNKIILSWDAESEFIEVYWLGDCT